MVRHAAQWKKGQSGNPKGRTPGVEKIRQLIEPRQPELIAKAIDMALAGDATALRMCIDRLAPPPRAEAAPVLIPGLAEARGLTAKAERIIEAVGNGKITPDSANMLLTALASYAKAIEVDEITERLDRIEMKGLL